MTMALNYHDDRTNAAQKAAAVITGLLGIACVFVGSDLAQQSPQHKSIAIALLGWGWCSAIIGIVWYWWCRRTEEK